mgnify:CR=1 FL=1
MKKEKEIDDMVKARVIEGEYKGRVGKADLTYLEETGNVMFYPIEGEYPYRVCLSIKKIEILEN